MSSEQKAKIVASREESRAVKDYLASLATRRPGRKVTAESVKARLNALEAKLAATDDPLIKIKLTQTLIDTETQLKDASADTQAADLEENFVKHARGFAARKGITYQAWRRFGVSSAVLAKAGIPRSQASRTGNPSGQADGPSTTKPAKPAAKKPAKANAKTASKPATSATKTAAK